MAKKPARRKAAPAKKKPAAKSAVKPAAKPRRKATKKRPAKKKGGGWLKRWLLAHLGGILVGLAMLFLLGVTLAQLGYLVFIQG